MIITMIFVALGLVLLGFPMWLILGVVSFIAVYFFLEMPLSIIAQTMFGSLNSFVLVAIPLFILTGHLMGRGTIASRLIDWIKSLIGRTPGGMAITTVGVNEIFGAMSGSAPATTATLGKILYPALRDDGYGRHFSAGLIASMGALSTIVPPSVNMILFAAAGSVSVAQLFIAGAVPSLMIMLVVGVYCVIYARRNITGRGETSLTSRRRTGIADEGGNDIVDSHAGPSGGEAFGDPQGRGFGRVMKTTWRASLALGVPVIIFGGIYSGLATPTEVAALSCLYAFMLSYFIYRDMNIVDVFSVFKDAAMVTASIFVIMASAGLFAWVLAIGQVPQTLVQVVDATPLPWWGILIIINLLLLGVGMLMDPVSAIVILTPILLPIATAIGVDPIHFGVIMVVNMGIGMFTPPFGLNLFVTMSVCNVSMGTVVRGLLPFFGLYVLILAIITYIPTVSLWLPTMIYR